MRGIHFSRINQCLTDGHDVARVHLFAREGIADDRYRMEMCIWILLENRQVAEQASGHRCS
jgi:hypothetical protein